MIVPFDPELHARFVFSAWCAGSGEPFERLHGLLRRGARCAVRVGQLNRDIYMGYAVVDGPQTVIWCYTKEKLRAKGIMRDLLDHLGVDIAKPIRALFWSPVADALVRKGWPLVYLDTSPTVPDARRTA